MIDTDKIMNLHIVSDPADIRYRIPINPEIWIRFLDHVWLRSDDMVVVCALRAQSSCWYYQSCRMSHAKFRTVWFCIVVSAHLPAAVHHHSQQPHQQQQHQLRLLNDDNSEALLPTDVEANVEAGSTVLLEFARPFDITMFLVHTT